MKNLLNGFTTQMFIVLMGLAIISACSTAFSPEASSPPITTNDLNNTHWLLKRIDTQTINSQPPITIEFNDGRVNGFTGCNQFFGTYTSSQDGVLAISPLGMTRMACMGQAGQVEQQFLDTISKISLYALTRNNELHLMDDQRKARLIYELKR